MLIPSNGTGVKQCGTAMTRATGRGRALSLHPKNTTGRMVSTETKPENSRFKPRDSGITAPSPPGASGVPDTHFSAGTSVVTAYFADMLFFYQELPVVKIFIPNVKYFVAFQFYIY